MIGVDLIGGIRRAYFEQRLPIKEIVRRLAVSRATVRRVIRSQKTEFKYERGVQRNGCSRSCVGAAMTAPTTACTALSRRGGRNERGFRRRRLCR